MKRILLQNILPLVFHHTLYSGPPDSCAKALPNMNSNSQRYSTVRADAQNFQPAQFRLFAPLQAGAWTRRKSNNPAVSLSIPWGATSRDRIHRGGGGHNRGLNPRPRWKFGSSGGAMPWEWFCILNISAKFKAIFGMALGHESGMWGTCFDRKKNRNNRVNKISC